MGNILILLIEYVMTHKENEMEKLEGNRFIRIRPQRQIESIFGYE